MKVSDEIERIRCMAIGVGVRPSLDETLALIRALDAECSLRRIEEARVVELTEEVATLWRNLTDAEARLKNVEALMRSRARSWREETPFYHDEDDDSMSNIEVLQRCADGIEDDLNTLRAEGVLSAQREEGEP